MNNNDARGELLLARLHIDAHTVAFHVSDQSINIRKPSERVIIKHIPLPISNETVINHRQYLFLRFKISLKLLYARDEQYSSSGQSVSDRDRFFYMEIPVVTRFPNLLR